MVLKSSLKNMRLWAEDSSNHDKIEKEIDAMIKLLDQSRN